MIRFAPFVFAAAPGTGTGWFMQAAEYAKLPVLEGVYVHQPAPPKIEALVVTLVRNPYDWLVHYYHSLRGGEVGVGVVDHFAVLVRESRSVEEFLWVYLKNCAGQVTQMFDAYAASTVLRVEDFPWCVLDLFQACGVDAKTLFELSQMPPVNHLSTKPLSIDPQIRAMVMRTERDFCQRYNYT